MVARPWRIYLLLEVIVVWVGRERLALGEARQLLLSGRLIHRRLSIDSDEEAVEVRPAHGCTRVVCMMCARSVHAASVLDDAQAEHSRVATPREGRGDGVQMEARVHEWLVMGAGVGVLGGVLFEQLALVVGDLAIVHEHRPLIEREKGHVGRARCTCVVHEEAVVQVAQVPPAIPQGRHNVGLQVRAGRARPVRCQAGAMLVAGWWQAGARLVLGRCRAGAALTAAPRSPRARPKSHCRPRPPGRRRRTFRRACPPPSRRLATSRWRCAASQQPLESARTSQAVHTQ